MLLDSHKVWIYNQVVDMRKAIDGLSQIVSDELEVNPTLEGTFVFWNRKRDKVKILYWHINGFCLLYKRLERSKFKLPRTMPEVLVVSTKELRWLLEGLDFTQLVGHSETKYEIFS